MMSRRQHFRLLYQYHSTSMLISTTLYNNITSFHYQAGQLPALRNFQSTTAPAGHASPRNAKPRTGYHVGVCRLANRCRAVTGGVAYRPATCRVVHYRRTHAIARTVSCRTATGRIAISTIASSSIVIWLIATWEIAVRNFTSSVVRRTQLRYRRLRPARVSRQRRCLTDIHTQPRSNMLARRHQQMRGGVISAEASSTFRPSSTV